ncbi:MAG: hypothetical protein AAF628_12760 [Planctomycetota bacterium]
MPTLSLVAIVLLIAITTARAVPDPPRSLDADLARLRGLDQEVAKTRARLEPDPGVAARTVRVLDAVAEERETLARRYAAALQRPDGAGLRAALAQLGANLDRCWREIARVAGTLPQRIDSDAHQARSMADLAKRHRDARPFLTGAIQLTLDRAAANLELLVAIGGNSDHTRRLEQHLRDAGTDVDAAHQTLEDVILRANEAPADLYAGDDRDHLLAAVGRAWREYHDRPEALELRIPREAWERHQGWHWRLDRFVYEDRSSLPVAILVAADDDIAHVYDAHVEQDHLAGDQVRVRLDDKVEMSPARRFLRAKLNL